MPRDLKVRVKSVKGKCNFGHKPGDLIEIRGGEIKGRICFSALAAMMPFLYAMRYNAEFPWLENKDVLTIGCPDHENTVVFEIERC